MCRPGLAGFAVVLFAICSAGAAHAWTARIAGVESVDDRLRSIASDAAGNLLVADTHSVAKRARPDGAQLWRTELVETADFTNFLGGLTVDAAGDVVVVGTLTESGASRDVVVWKLSGLDGHVLWRLRFDGPAHDFDSAGAVAIDPNGDVIVGGTTYLIAEDMLALKIDGATGVEEWHAVIPGPTPGGQDQGLAVAVDANGDVAVVGDSTTAGLVDRLAAIKLRGSDGALLWRAFAAGPEENGQATDAAFDAAGDLIVLGSIAFDATGFDVAVLKLDGATGAERWHRYVDGSAHEFEFGERLAVDDAGNVVAVGRVVNTGSGADMLVLRLRPDGSEAWRRELDGGAGRYDGALDVALVGDRVVVAAAIDGTSYEHTRFAALGFDAASGAEAWRRTRDGVAGGRDRAMRVAVGSDGQVFVAGELAGSATKSDGLVLDLAAATGVKQWDVVLNDTVPDDDAALSVAVDAAGDAIVSGTVGTRRAAEDFTVVKLAGATGAEEWRVRIDGAMHLDDAGGLVAVDGAGDVLAAGTTVDGPGLPPTDPRYPGLPPLTNVTVVKLDGATGAERWRSAPSFGSRGYRPAATDLALAGADLVVAGWFGTPSYESRSAVVKLRGADGAELWRKSYDTVFVPEYPVEAEVDAAGDVVVASQGSVDKLRGSDGTSLWGGARFGTIGTRELALDAGGDAFLGGQSGYELAIQKIRGGDGSVAWTALQGIGRALAVRVDAAGDVVAAGEAGFTGEEQLKVVKVDGGSGATLWTRIAPGRAPASGLTLALDAAGDVIVGGAASMPGRGEDFAVLKLCGTDGRIRWRRLVDGGGRADDRGQALALDPAGNAFAAGILRGAVSGDDFAVSSFDGRTGRSVGALPGPLRRNAGRFSGDRGTTSTK